MSRRTEALTDELYEYLLSVSLRETDVLRRLREETATLESAQMQIGPEQGQFMALLVELTGARNTLEIGTFTGYSALVVALALPDDGRVVACDIQLGAVEPQNNNAIANASGTIPDPAANDILSVLWSNPFL